VSTRPNTDPRGSSSHERQITGRLPDAGRRLVQFARQLVATPSPSGSEQEVARLLATQLASLGYRDIEVDTDSNVVAYFGDGPPTLMFNGHMDHVPPAGMEEPFTASLEPGERWNEPDWGIRGRGSCDMKANVAAGAYAAAFLDPKRPLRGSYVFTADVQEETDSPAGVQALIDRGVRATYGLSGESTDLELAVGHRGKLQLDLIVRGRASHASSPEKGINAVYRAQPFLHALEEAAARLPSHPTFGPATLTVTGIHSEPATGVAVVPSACLIRVDRRYTPGETPEQCVAELKGLVDDIAAQSGAEAEVELVNVYPLMQTVENHPLVDAGCGAVEMAIAKKPELITWRFGVNATFMNHAEIPTIGIGPGNEKWAHTSEEHVPLGQLVDAARIYAELIAALCGDSSQPRMDRPWHG
jgi:putative selenium metabolism hydrolase